MIHERKPIATWKCCVFCGKFKADALPRTHPRPWDFKGDQIMCLQCFSIESQKE